MSDDYLRRLIGQIMICGFPSPYLDPQVQELIREYHVGNIILFARNILSYGQIAELTGTLQKLARDNGQTTPLIIATDQENGMVSRLSPDIPGLPGNMALGAAQDANLAYDAGVMTGKFLQRAGINMNLAPVLDINNNPLNPVIGVRSFGDAPLEVGSMGLAMVQGLEKSGVLACGKHFPGHGDTYLDSHRDLPHIGHDLKRMHHFELIPFKAVIDKGIAAIMTAHIVFDQLDPLHPATLSPQVLGGLLRDTLGFGGVITTDCLEMAAISGTVGVGPGAVMALAAGADMIMVSHRLAWQKEAMNAIYEALTQGVLPLSRLEEAGERIARLKTRVSLPAEYPAGEMKGDLTRALKLQEELSLKALNCLYDQGEEQGSSQPIPFPSPTSVYFMYDANVPPMMVQGPMPAKALTDSLRLLWEDVRIQVSTVDEAMALTDKLSHYDWLIYLSSGLTAPDENLGTLLSDHPHSVVWLVRTPYLFPWFKNHGAKRVYALYENTPWMMKAALRALLGQGAWGRLAVRVEDYPAGYKAYGGTMRTTR